MAWGAATYGSDGSIEGCYDFAILGFHLCSCLGGLLPKGPPEFLHSLRDIVRESPTARIFLTGRLHIREYIQRYFTKAVMIPEHLHWRYPELFGNEVRQGSSPRRLAMICGWTLRELSRKYIWYVRKSIAFPLGPWCMLTNNCIDSSLFRSKSTPPNIPKNEWFPVTPSSPSWSL